MQQFDLYNDIANRTGGNIYIGVVGPVRTGKSTFVSKFMEEIVIPNIENKPEKQRAIDELPQSADGKTIMTTEPKFVPAEAIAVTLNENMKASVRLIDCVGYLVKEATGHMEGDRPRMVKTPWSDQEMSFEKAGEMGTSKVINDHSTIGIVVTTDGSVTDISRGDYVPAEERVIKEMQAIGKPFVILLNSKNPTNNETIDLADNLSKKYGKPVIAKNIKNMDKSDIDEILYLALMEFPIRLVEVVLPKWMQALDVDSEIIKEVIGEISNVCKKITTMKEYECLSEVFKEHNKINTPNNIEINLGVGSVNIELSSQPDLFYEVLSSEAGKSIDDDFKLLAYIKSLSEAEKQYSVFKEALREVEATGYGIVTPTLEQMTMEEPQMVKSGGRFGVKLKASAPSLHIMRVDVETEINPVVGTEQQSEELVKYLLSEFENNKAQIWDTNMFGKPLSSLVKEGLNNKLIAIPMEVQGKMRRTMGRIVNEGKGGVLCILL